MSLLDIGEKLKGLFSGASNFVKQNPTPASFVGRQIQPLQQFLQQSPMGYANQQFQQRVAQPVAQRISNTPIMPFLPSVTPRSYVQGQIVNPIKQGINQLQQPGLFNKAMGAGQLFGGAASATPQGALWNIGSGVMAGIGQSVREKKNPQKTIAQGINTPTSVASTGLGINNPLMALGVDLLSPSLAGKGIKIAQAKGILNIPGLSKVEGALADSKGFFDKIASTFQSGVSGEDRKKVITELAQEAKRHAAIFEMSPKEIEQAVMRSPEGWIKKLQEKSTLFLADRARATSYGVKTNIVKPSTGGEIGGTVSKTQAFKDAGKSIYNSQDIQVKGDRIISGNSSMNRSQIIKELKNKIISVDFTVERIKDDVKNNLISEEQANNSIRKIYEEAISNTKTYNNFIDANKGYFVSPKANPMHFQESLDLIPKSSSGEIPKGVTTPISTQPELKTMGIVSQNIQGSLPSVKVSATQPQIKPTVQMKDITRGQSTVTSDSIISEARKQIGTAVKEDKRPIKQILSDAYTQWVDRYNPVVKKAQEAKGFLKIKQAQLRPENDPEVLLRRLTGAGGIADTRYQTELKPVIDQLDALKIDKLDMDAYLANKRIAGFGQAGRDIYGADPVKAQQVVGAMEGKYGTQISQLADQLYTYQDKGLQEMVQAGFISPEAAQSMKGQNPDYAPLKRVMDDVSDYIGLPTRKLQQGTNPVYKIKGSTRQIDSPIENIIANTFQQRAAIEKNRVASSIAKLQEITDLGFTKAKESSPDTITVWKNGQKEYWNVGKEIADTVKGVNEESMNVVLKILQAPASILRQGATGRNPEFMIPNIIRDQLDAGVSSKYGYIPFVDYVSGLKSVLTEDKAYQSWAQSGAKIDLGEMSGRKSITESFNQATKKQGLFRWFTNMLDVAGKYSEQPTRVGLYKKAMQKTGNELLSMMESRDATVDFARMGSKMKVANSIVPFLNVGVQGFDKLIRAVKDNPEKVAILATTYAAAPQVMSQIYNLTNHPEEYAEIPQYVKDSNFVFVIGRNQKGNVDYVTIPKGNITPVVANPIQSYVDYLYKVDGQSFKQMAMSLVSDTLPVLSPGGSLQEVAVKTIGSNIPQAVKPLAENLLNKSFFKYDAKKEQSKEIVPSYIQKKPAYQQSYEWTPQMYKTVGAALNASPLKVQNLLEGYLAGYVKIPAQMIDAAVSISRNEKVDANDKTILRRFIQETLPQSSKPAIPKPESPPIMERITGKASAAEKTQTEEQIQAKDLASRDKLRYSKKTILEENGKFYLKKNTESGVSINTIDPSFQPTKPTLTGLAELDKKAISKFNGEITSKANDIYDLYKAGKLTQDEANTQLSELKTLKASTGGKKLKKLTFKKIPVKKFKFSMPKPVKMATLKIKPPPAPKLSKSKTIKIAKAKKIKIKKLKGLTA